MIINQLNRVSEGEADEQDSKGLCDTNGDGSVTPLDALLVINAMDDAQETSHQERHTHRLLFRLDTTALFTKFDANGNENLDADELPERLRSCWTLRESTWTGTR